MCLFAYVSASAKMGDGVGGGIDWKVGKFASGIFSPLLFFVLFPWDCSNKLRGEFLIKVFWTGLLLSGKKGRGDEAWLRRSLLMPSCKFTIIAEEPLENLSLTQLL